MGQKRKRLSVVEGDSGNKDSHEQAPKAAKKSRAPDPEVKMAELTHQGHLEAEPSRGDPARAAPDHSAAPVSSNTMSFDQSEQPRSRGTKEWSRTARSPAPSPPASLGRSPFQNRDDRQPSSERDQSTQGHAEQSPASAASSDEEPVSDIADSAIGSDSSDDYAYSRASPHFSPSSMSPRDGQSSQESDGRWSPPKKLASRSCQPLTCTFFWDHTITTIVELDLNVLAQNVSTPAPGSIWCRLRDLVAEALRDDGYILRQECGEHLHDLRIVWPYHGGWTTPEGLRGSRRETKLREGARLLRILEIAVRDSLSVYLEFKVRDREMQEVLQIDRRSSRHECTGSGRSQGEHPDAGVQQASNGVHRSDQERPGGGNSEQTSFRPAPENQSSINAAFPGPGARRSGGPHLEELKLTNEEYPARAGVLHVSNSQKTDRIGIERDRRRQEHKDPPWYWRGG